MFQISLTSRCNLACWHCPMARYRNTDNPDYVLTNKRLLPWIYMNLPTNWVIELTGGESALYNGIDELIGWLVKKNYHVVVKTNGLLPIEPNPGAIRVAAFHQLNNPPKYFDKILIVDQIDSEEKERVCKENGWDYRLIGLDNEPLPGESHGFKFTGYMDPHGHPLQCKHIAVKYTDWPDKYALEYTRLKKTRCCSGCKAAIDCWKFIPDDWKR